MDGILREKCPTCQDEELASDKSIQGKSPEEMQTAIMDRAITRLTAMATVGSLAVAPELVMVRGVAWLGRTLGIRKKAAPAIKATTPYVRPSNATTPAQRASVQGKPCVKCGDTTLTQRAGHKKPLVKEHYQTGGIDRIRMRSNDAVQPECPTCSNREGTDLSRYSREMRRRLDER